MTNCSGATGILLQKSYSASESTELWRYINLSIIIRQAFIF